MTLRSAMGRVFAAQTRFVASRVSLEGELPNFGPWVQAAADAAKPYVLRQFQEGMLLLAHGELSYGMRRHGPFNPFTLKRAGMKVDAFNPRVLDAVDELTLKFCRETNRTATASLKESLAALRELLKRGLKRGDATKLLAKRIRSIFADPYRAAVIAHCETRRAKYAGWLMAAEDADDVKSKVWRASASACEDCMKLDGRKRKLSEPFTVLKAGGPYAVIMHPPYHPWCDCSVEAV